MDHCKNDDLLVIVIGWLNESDQNQRGRETRRRRREISTYPWGISLCTPFLPIRFSHYLATLVEEIEKNEKNEQPFSIFHFLLLFFFSFLFFLLLRRTTPDQAGQGERLHTHKTRG